MNVYYCVDFIDVIVVGIYDDIIVDVVVFGVNGLGVIFVLC